MLDENLLCIHHVTVLQQWSLKQLIDGLARHRVNAIGVWRDKLRECGLAEAARMLKGQGLTVTALGAAGLLTSPDPVEDRRARDDVRLAIDEAAAIGARCLIFVAGGIDARDKNLDGARARALAGLADLAPHARAAGVRIALEPLHPMVCASRSVLSSLGLANDWCDALAAEDVFGIAVDTYAVWWDPDLEAQIARAGRRVCGFHVSDWLADTRDLRLDRGMMGDGVIDIPGIRRWVEAAGYKGHREVEIFSARDWWTRDPDEVIRVAKERYQTAV